MNYRQSIDYLLSFADFERSGRFRDRPDVRPVLSLLRRLGDPHLGRRTVHIAGSKGKGSVAAMVESILRAAKLRTGLFTSPHLHEYTERIRIDGEPLAKEEWARLTRTLRDAVESGSPASADRSLVTFDLLTALAFLAFREHGVDCQILETGLGGRVDSTNVFATKDVCAVTAISLEHTDVLGGTVERIAGEKAGIVRPGATVVIGPQPAAGGARRVIAEAAASARCLTVDVAASYTWRRIAHDLSGQTFHLKAPRGSVQLRLPLLGLHQLENAATAVACADALTQRGVSIPSEAIDKGLAGVSWPGRMEILRREPLVIADGAHSRESARRLRECLTDYLSCGSAFQIVGMSADKDVSGLAQELAPIASRVIAVRADHPRAMPAKQVAAAFVEAGAEVEMGAIVSQALEKAMAAAVGEEVICLTGSLFVVAEGRNHLKKSGATA
ncbi:MAG: folylpolyglutamate synthase/dihydrofolate synthase family protein [Dehalococcoidia bacterium]